MQYLDIYNSSLTHITRLYTWVSIVWQECYNTAGSMQIELRPDSELISMCQVGSFIRYSESDAVMMVKSIQISKDSVIINGTDAVAMFGGRVVPAQETGNAETLIRSVVSACTALPVTLGASASLAALSADPTKAGTALATMEAIAKSSGIGFRLRLVSGAFVFSCYQPAADANMKLSTKYGSITDIVYSDSTNDFYNVAVIYGPDNLTMAVGETTSTGLARFEMLYDATNATKSDDETTDTFKERLRNEALDELAKHSRIQSVEFSTFDDDLTLGAMPTVIVPEYSVNTQLRVTQIEITNQNNITTRAVTVGSII